MGVESAGETGWRVNFKDIPERRALYMSENLRPTPETDAECFVNEGDVVTVDFARRLERERDEAREIAKKYEDRYFTMSELRNNASIVALQYKAQRDRLVEALEKVEFFGATGCLQDSLDEAKRIARAALAEFKGSAS